MPAKRKGSRSGSRKGSAKRSSSVSSLRGLEPVPEKTLEESRQRLWLSIPTVAAVLEKVAAAEAERSSPPPPPEEGAPPVDHTADVVVPWPDMQKVVRNLYLATHGNPTPVDIETAIAEAIGTADAPEKPEYTKADIFHFLDKLPKKWLPQLELPLVSSQRAKLIRQLNQELVDCITFDDPPHHLLEPEQVLMMNQTLPQPTMLTTPVANFISFAPSRQRPEVISMLWRIICGEDEVAHPALTLEQFQSFFAWFYSMHFSNTTTARSNAAATYLWFDCLNEKGAMCASSFQRACTYICRHYAQRRDTAAYLFELVKATHEVMSSCEADGASFLTAGGLVTEGISPRQVLEDPNALYIPDEVRFWRYEEDLYETGPSRNRVILHGGHCTGKTAAGAALASAMHCAQLEVLDLAMKAALDSEDALGKELVSLAKEGTPIPLSLQAALLRREVVQPRSVYHGYVLSDTFPFSASHAAAAEEFFQQAGLVSDVIPTVVVEMTCESSLHLERLHKVQTAHGAEYEAELSREEAEKEKARLAQERSDRRAAYLEVIDKLDAINTAETEEEITEEDIVALQEEANAAQEALAVMDAEDDEEAAKAEEADHSPEALAEAEAREEQRERHSLEVRLRYLIDESRSQLYDASNDFMPLTSLPCLKKTMDIADTLQRSLTVEGASRGDHVASYVMEALHLQPAFVATEPGLAEAATRDLPESVAGDEELGKIKEDAAASLGFEPSHIWKHYCPVTFAEEGLLVEGVGCYACTFRNRMYYMTSKARMEKFMASPFQYLAQKPADSQRLLLLASDSVAQHLPDAETVLASFGKRLAEVFHLTKLSFNEYSVSISKHLELCKERAAALATRSEYEHEERKLRAERREKRLKLEAKQKKSNRPKKPAMKKKGSVAPSTISIPEVAPEISGANDSIDEMPPVERMEHVVAQQIEQLRETRMDEVPILLSILSERDLTMESFETVFGERLLPENIVLLSCEPPVDESKAENEDAAAAPQEDDDQDDEEEESPPSILSVVLDKLSEAPRHFKTKEGEKLPQTFTINTVNLFGTTEEDAILDIIQRLNPAAMPVTQGMVEEDDEDDEEDEEDEEEDEDDEDEQREPPVKEKVDPMLKPRRRFLHQFGSRLQFCPVTLAEKRMLVRGLNDYTLRFMDDLYCFASAECLEKFTASPFKYIGENPPGDIPPRLWLVGANNAGKRTLAAGLSNQFSVPHFTFSREFLEKCIEAASSPTGAEVEEGLFIPSAEQNPFAEKGMKVLKELRDFDADQKNRLKLREEAEKIMEERERKEEERANRSDDEESDEEGSVDEAREEMLQENLEFEAEDEEDAAMRLNEAYLRMLCCVSRLEPFESKGYIMVSPAFGEEDLELIFAEGGIPEVVLHLTLAPDVYAKRLETLKAKHAGDSADGEDEDGSGRKHNTFDLRRRERALRRWRRRHIGVDDPPSDPEEEGDEEQAGEGGNARKKSDDDAPDQQDDEELENLEEFLEGMEDRRVDVVSSHGDMATATVLRGAADQLQRYFANRLSYFYAGQVTFYDDAQKMLAESKADLSSFGRVDPVLLYEERDGARRACVWKEDGITYKAEKQPSTAPKPKFFVEREKNSDDDDQDEEDNDDRSSTSQGALNDNANNNNREEFEDEEMSEYGSEDLEEARERWERKQHRVWKKVAPRCVLLRHRIYFFKDDQTLKKFLLNPLRYMLQPPPAPKIRTMPVLSIFEDDIFTGDMRNGVKSRALAESVAVNTGAVFVSVSKLLSWAALNPILGSLATGAISSALQAEVRNELLGQLLLIRLACADVKEKGAVLLNLPRSAHQAEQLAARSCCASIQKTVRLFSNKGSLPHSSEVADFVDKYAIHTLLPVPRASYPMDAANLSVIVSHMDDLVRDERDAVLREMCAFPTDLKRTYHTRDQITADKSTYRWYCPYCWVEQDDLVYVRTHDPCLAASYLGKYYFFSDEAFLKRFLLEPFEVADPTTTRPLPPCLPEPIAETLESVDGLEYQGCCPVLLYDTRENRGLRGVLEPRAKLGSLSCVVRYDGKLYACFNEENKIRFLKRPWQYVDGAMMPPPRKCPLTKEDLANGVNDDYYMRRQLYDYVAHAILAVCKVRPKYPGLTEEESVLKYMALHIKANREECGDIEHEQYRENLDLYEKRSTLYRTMTMEDFRNPERKEEIENLCVEYETMLNGYRTLDDLGHLKNISTV